MANLIGWCDIPVTDLNRAMTFYGAVLAAKLEKQEFSGKAFAVLPHADSGVSGCLTNSDPAENKPSPNGPLIYISCQGRLDEAVALVEPNGGKLLVPRHQIGPYGFRAVVLDSEGNRIALHTD
jgi:predicted enzyme related to lactoylglutathione lyase